MLKNREHRINRITVLLLAIFLPVFSLSGQSCDLNAAFTDNPTCNGQVSFTDNSTSSVPVQSWQWDFGDNSPQSYLPAPTHTYANGGTYNVRLIVTDANFCFDTIIKSVNVPVQPVPGFSVDTLVCQGEPVSFVNTTDTVGMNITSWFWQTGDGNTAYTADLSHVYTSSGTYTITLTAAYGPGCNVSVSKSITVMPLPTPAIDWQMNCADNIVYFSDTAAHSINIIDHTWDFGDNSYSTAAAPVHYYASSGSYNIQLSVTNANGCQGTAGAILYLGDPLEIGFNNFQVCDGDTVTMNANVFTGSVPVSSWAWDLGDGNTANGQYVSHQYSSPGTYMVTLTATDSNGCVAVSTQSGRVFANPQAAFDGNDVFFGIPTEFIDKSQAASNPIITKYWDFGDGSAPQACVQDTTNYTYPSPGDYDATLYVADSLGCHDTAKGLMEVWSNYAKANWIADTVCTGQLTQFEDQSMVGSGSIVSWFWDFGDNAVSYQQNPVHSYDTAGVFQVVLVITTDLGVTDSAKASVLVHESPVAEFDYSNACEEDKKVFYNFSSISAGGSIVAYEWDLGDGSVSSLIEPQRTYYSTGSYDVSLTVTSAHGCVDSVTHTFEVAPKPVIAFGADEYMGCEAGNIEFTDSSSLSYGIIESWEWDFGDGYISSETHEVNHTYTGVGSYDVKLTLVTDKGCSATKTIPSMIDIHPNPVAEFSFTPRDADVHRPTVYFKNNSLGGDVYYWHFGDGNSAKLFEPVYNYTTPGTFTIRLVAETYYGCTDVKERTINVKSEPVFFVPNAFTPNGDGKNDFFEPVGTPYNESGSINFSMEIFDRAGNLIFDSSAISEPWDGNKRSGEAAPEGVYVCRIIYQDITRKQHTHVGKVTLLR